MNEKIVLDSFALVSLFHREPGWQVVQRALYDQEKSRSRAILSWINWGEFYYIVKRRVGEAKTKEALRLLEQLPIDLLPVDQALVQAAAEIKSAHAVSYADAFCIATAQRLDATVLTGDPEFGSVEHLVKIHWLTK
ncbi:MAG TPA: type II toxin-antitoxin system VapC family toxin [Candidatus Acidoferrales bacterium]|nr:type II toxin-antitoxin system VapC family toxin [Candidatus Acidoferrales bacterium]